MKKLFTRYTIIAFILGLAVMPILYRYFPEDDICTGKNIGVIAILGEIDTVEDPEYWSASAPDVIRTIEELETNKNIRSIMLDINSGGGSMESSESIMLAIKKVTKPTVALVRNGAFSGAFLIATGADRIYASKFSEVGSIGVTWDFKDTSQKDMEEGVVFYDFSSGEHKSVGKDYSLLTQSQRDVIIENIMKAHAIFVEYVADNRNLSVEKVAKIADGRVYVGEDALKLGLIDQIGGLPEAGLWLKEQIGEEPSFCYMGE